MCLYVLYVLPHRLTGNHHLDIPLHGQQKLLEAVPLALRARFRHMHEDGTVRFSCIMQDAHNDTNYERWTDTGGPTAWPSRLPHSTPLDFYFRNTQNPLCTQLLLRHFTHALRTSAIPPEAPPSPPGNSERIRQSAVKCVEQCTESHARHFEHLLQCTLSDMKQKCDASGHMLVGTAVLFWYVELVPKLLRSFQLPPLYKFGAVKYP